MTRRDNITRWRAKGLWMDVSKSLFQKPYAVVRLRGRLYRNRSRYFAPVSRRSIN